MKNYLIILLLFLFYTHVSTIDTNSEEYTKFLDSLTPENIQLKMTAPFLDQNNAEEMKILKEMENIHSNLNNKANPASNQAQESKKEANQERSSSLLKENWF